MSSDQKDDGEDDCVIPPEFPKAELRNFVFKQDEHEVREITEYVEWQCNKALYEHKQHDPESTDVEELVQHAEKVKTERVMGVDYDVWDVHTNIERWWVITNPTNLYSQKLMPSLDYTLSFHIGLMARVQAKREISGADEAIELLSVTHRKIYQTQVALDEADEIEDFQAIGLQCRETMTTFTHELIASDLLGDIDDPPKKGDFVAWAERIVGLYAAGSSAEYVRGYLKATTLKGWQLAIWLTHSKNATRHSAELCVSATEHLMFELIKLVLPSAQDKDILCSRCGSSKIRLTYRSEDSIYVARCEVCGLEAPQDA
jgi:hypothetical protein